MTTILSRTSSGTLPAPDTAPALLADARDLTEPVMRKAVDTLTPAVRRVVTYQLGWSDAHGAPSAANGKALRPALVLLAGAAVRGRTSNAGTKPSGVQAALPGAVAVELVHNFSLLHDDVMDGDAERRHRPTAWTVFGPAAAILAGDAMLELATQVMLDAPGARARAAERRIAEATQRLIAGQAADLEFEARTTVDLDECIEMAVGKTASLLSCASAVGAVLAGGSLPLIAAMQAFGHHLGLAFQLVDDLLGIWGSPQVTGKPAGSDLRSKKKTLPVVAALAGSSDAARALRSLYGEGRALTDAEVTRAARLVDQAGGRRWAADEARRQLELARSALAGAGIDPTVRADLEAIAAFVGERDH